MKALTNDEKCYIKQRIIDAIEGHVKALKIKYDTIYEKLKKSLYTTEGIKEYIDIAEKHKMKVDIDYNRFADYFEISFGDDRNNVFVKLKWKLEALNKTQRKYYDEMLELYEEIYKEERITKFDIESQIKKYYIEFTTWTGKYTERLDYINRLINKIITDLYKYVWDLI